MTINKGGRPVGSGVQHSLFKTESGVKVSATIGEFYEKSEEELAIISDDQKSSMLHKTIANMIMKCNDDINIPAMNFLMDRWIGKVVEKIDNTSSDGSMSPTNIFNEK